MTKKYDDWVRSPAGKAQREYEMNVAKANGRADVAAVRDSVYEMDSRGAGYRNELTRMDEDFRSGSAFMDDGEIPFER